MVGERELYSGGRNVLDDMRIIDGCDMDNIDTLHSSKRTIGILGDRWWPQTAKREGGKPRKQLHSFDVIRKNTY